MPLVDVLLVLLVLGVLTWAGHRVGGVVSPRVEPVPELLPGLTLPLRHATDTQRLADGAEKMPLIGLGLHGHVTWRGTPVTRDILEQQLRQALEHDPQADVWLAADEALPYADLLPWLEWLQARQVSRLTLLTRSPSSAQMSGKP
jgi:biopolymer transport protein ExbD